jgi:A nuclease family of the HNH/ENDO VII superfamily with conserved AHH
MAIGRFMSIDPLAEKYAYNSTYAFQENKMGVGRELEGLEVEIFFENTSLTPEFLTKISEVSVEEIGEIGGIVEEHHLIPKALKGEEIIEAAREEGFKFEGQENKIPLEKFSRATGEGQHGNHPNYNNAVKNLLKDGPGKLTPLEFIRTLTSNLKTQIKNNPTTKINDLLKSNVVIDKTRIPKPPLPKPAPKPKPVPITPPKPLPHPKINIIN